MGQWRLHLNTILGPMFNSLDTGKIAQDPTLECHSMKEHTLSIESESKIQSAVFLVRINKNLKKKHWVPKHRFFKKKNIYTKIAFTVSRFKLGHFAK